MNELPGSGQVAHGTQGNGETTSSAGGAASDVAGTAGVRASRPASPVGTRWQTRLPEGIVAGPVAGNGRLYVRSRSGRIYALDADDGAERWRANVGTGTTRPATGDGTVIFGNANGTVRALDATDGTTRWTYEVDGAVEAAPVVREGTVHVASDRGQVCLVDAESGDRRAAFGNGCRAVCSLAVGRETVLLGSLGGGVQARCVTDGRERWRTAPDQAVVAAPAVAEERSYVATVDGDCVRAIDRVTGALRQRFEVGSAVWGRPAVTEGAVVATGRDGVVAAFDRETGVCRWRSELRGSAWCGPTVAAGQVHVADDVGRVYGLDAADGYERWQFETDAAVTTAPTIADGAVVVADEAGTVSALSGTGI